MIADGSDGEIILVPFIDLFSTGSGTVSGDRTVLVSTQRTSQGLDTRATNLASTDDYWIVVESDRPNAWKKYFESLALDVKAINNVEVVGERTVQVELNSDEIDRIDVVRTEIETRFR